MSRFPPGITPDVWVVFKAAHRPFGHPQAPSYANDPFPELAMVVSVHRGRADAIDALRSSYHIGLLANWGAAALPRAGDILPVTTEYPKGPMGLYPLVIYNRNPQQPRPTHARVSHASDYLRFHGVDPDTVFEAKAWVPGPLVYIGRGVDVGYNIIDHRSNKDGWYVHDFGHGVSVYRRARDNEQPTKVLSNFPGELLVLGSNLGFTYEDEQGRQREVKGSLRKKLCTTPDKRKLVIVGPSGVEFMAWGGKMRVVDWIYN